MIRAGVGQSTKVAVAQAATEAANQAMARAGCTRADAVMVFFAADNVSELKQLFPILRRVTGTDCIVGSSGAGILTGAGEIEGHCGVAVLILASDQFQLRPFLCQPLRDRDDPLGVEIGALVACPAGANNLTVLFPDSYNSQPARLLQSIAKIAGGVPVVGAGSSESGGQGATYQMCADTISNNAVAGLCFSGSFGALIDITQGCQPISSPMVITKAERNLIFEINHRPATEAFAQVLKGPLAEDVRRALMYIFVGLPADPDENSVAAGNYLVRNIIGLDMEQGIVGVADDVRPGQSMIFALRDGERARDDLNQMLARQVRRLEGRKPAFGFYFNCCARGQSLYGLPGMDTAYITQALGEFPLIGIFGGFELAPLGKANQLFAYTGVLVLITESE